MWLQSAREHRFHAFLESPLTGVVQRLLFSLLVRWEIRVHWVEVRTQCLVKAGLPMTASTGMWEFSCGAKSILDAFWLKGDPK